ncbi:MAG: type II toxin-antitoxin system HicA family toxin [Acidimicrobiia bacterium]
MRMLTGRRFGCAVVRQRGSHAIVQWGECRMVVPIHSTELAPGPWKQIQTSLAPRFGEKRWGCELSKPVNQARAAMAHAEADRQRRDQRARVDVPR